MGQSLEAALAAVSMLPAQEDVLGGWNGQDSSWGAVDWAGLEAPSTQQGAPAQ